MKVVESLDVRLLISGSQVRILHGSPLKSQMFWMDFALRFKREAQR
ncbi:hypothetical protein RB2654_14225 [Rhodobacterales bacterium HTCC2654]|uniref:Uncharacterized protein n=1 Tax=Maritimibacter alkaliphilus HTCC2654 TaxID=314271 RepID=A3VGP4_9RHOB|nr:hypothetical protein RB2654_14225 [Rhodobacterales bacterium HTCC2654] [Maritimibacter alkaliphilus HTCC2654]